MAAGKGIFSNLRLKISIYILIGAVIFSGVVIFVMSHYLNETLSESLIKQGQIIGKSISELAAEKLIEEDAVGLKKVVEKYKYYVNNEYLLIVDSQHKVVTDTYNGSVPAELQNEHGVNDCLYCDFDFSNSENVDVALFNVNGIDVYDITIPIKDGLLGFVRVGLTKRFVDEKVNATILYIGIIIAIGTLLAIFVALTIITVQVTRPIINLANAANEISLGNFNTPVEVKVKNELQILATAIDRMKESLKTSLERLKTRSTIGRF